MSRLDKMLAIAGRANMDAPGAQAFIARNLSCGVVNAGDGAHSHPTQALLDIFQLTHEQTDFLASYPDETSFTAEQEAQFLREKTAYVISFYV